MKSEHCGDRLSAYLDGELSRSDQAACEAHLSECPECSTTLDELRAVVREASLLPDLPPERDLWAGIEGRLTPRHPAGAARGATGRTDPVAPADLSRAPRARRRRTVVMTVPQLAAAVVALIVLSAGGVWLALPGLPGLPGSAAMSDGGAGDPAAMSGVPTTASEPRGTLAAAYEPTISQLEVEFDRRRSELDPETIRVVEDNLAIIDSAIADAGHALEKDPASAFLSTHLAGALRRKVDLLLRVTAIERTES